jgi:hypothetical protein
MKGVNVAGSFQQIARSVQQEPNKRAKTSAKEAS